MASCPRVRTRPRYGCSPRNPCIATRTSYGPGGSAATRYQPRSSDTTSRVQPVSAFAMVMVAPGSTPPCSSATVPCSVAPVVWAKAETDTTTTYTKASHTGVKRAVIAPSDAPAAVAFESASTVEVR